MSNLVLTAQHVGETEKKSTAFKKDFKKQVQSMRRTGAQFIAHRILIGHKLNAAKEHKLFPHGEFETWVREECGLADTTQQDWRATADAFLAEMAKLPKSPTVGLLTKGGKLAVDAILELWPKVMKGRNAKELVSDFRDLKLLNEPAEPGGDRGGHSGPRKPNAEQQREEANTYVADQVLHLKMLSQDKANLILCDTAKLNELEEARVALGRHIAEIKANRKVPAAPATKK